MGWNQIEIKKDTSLFYGIENRSHMYFVHSYEFLTKEKDCVIATTNYGNSIIVAIQKENIFGTQFHPEKSQHNGLKLLENFLKWEVLMIIFPAIDIKDGKCVRLLKGDFNKITSYEKSPLEQANFFSKKGFKNIHIVDLDGALLGLSLIHI